MGHKPSADVWGEAAEEQQLDQAKVLEALRRQEEVRTRTTALLRLLLCDQGVGPLGRLVGWMGAQCWRRCGAGRSAPAPCCFAACPGAARCCLPTPPPPPAPPLQRERGVEGDDRKRGYNSLAGQEVDVTPEEMEAYR